MTRVRPSPVTPRHSFPIYCEPRRKSRLHYRVLVFKNSADLQRHAAAQSTHSRRSLLGTKGMCMPFVVRTYFSGRERRRTGRVSRTRPICGEILLTDTYLNSMAIAHECAHAALAYAERAKFDPRDKGPADRRSVGGGEERFCLVLGDLVGQVYWQLARRGYLTHQTAKKRRGRVLRR